MYVAQGHKHPFFTMTNWTTLSQDELKLYLAPGQLDMLLEQLPYYHLDNPIPMVLSSTIERIRFEIHTSACMPLDKDPNTIPTFLSIAAYHLALESLASLLPGVELSPHQKQQAKNARECIQKMTDKKGNSQQTISPSIHYGKKRNGICLNDLKGL